MDAWVAYRGGPWDGQLHLGVWDSSMLIRIGHPEVGYYRVTEHAQQTDKGLIPVAVYVGDEPPNNVLPSDV